MAAHAVAGGLLRREETGLGERTIRTFFYGAFMHREVVARRGIVLNGAEVASLPGFAIRMQPLSNVVLDEGACVYGLLVRLTRRGLDRLYAHLPDATGDGTPPTAPWNVYLPEAVLVWTPAGAWCAALCYVAPCGAPRLTASTYLDDILEAAREYRFPDWYMRHLEAARA